MGVVYILQESRGCIDYLQGVYSSKRKAFALARKLSAASSTKWFVDEYDTNSGALVTAYQFEEGKERTMKYE